MQLVIPVAQIVNEAAPYIAASGTVTHYCRVQYMGGEIRVSNPSKIPNGAVKDARIDITLRQSAKTYTSKDTKQTGALVAQECQFVALAGVSK